jgi:TnpA family transposase
LNSAVLVGCDIAHLCGWIFAESQPVRPKILTAHTTFSRRDPAEELGRIERTLFTLDWLEPPRLRQLCQAGLNKSEQRHALAQVISTFRQGRIADREQDAQQFRASGLNLVIAAIIYWNSTYLTDAIDHIRTQGKTVPAARPVSGLLQPQTAAFEP